MIFDKGTKAILWRNDSPSTICAGAIGYSNLNLDLVSYTEVNPKCKIDLNVKYKTDRECRRISSGSRA